MNARTGSGGNLNNLTSAAATAAGAANHSHLGGGDQGPTMPQRVRSGPQLSMLTSEAIHAAALRQEAEQNRARVAALERELLVKNALLESSVFRHRTPIARGTISSHSRRLQLKMRAEALRAEQRRENTRLGELLTELERLNVEGQRTRSGRIDQAIGRYNSYMT